MARRTKRFIKSACFQVVSLFVVGVLMIGVKGADAIMLKDKVLSIDGPLSLSSERHGALVMDTLVFDPSINLGEWLEEGADIQIVITADAPDRYNRYPAQIYLEDSRWLQGELVRNGLARVYTHNPKDSFVPNLMQLERWAQNSKRGGWKTGPFKVFSTLDEEIPRNQFAIVRGTVIDVAVVKDVTYVNFGANWRTDFTVRIQKKAQKLFQHAGFDLAALKGNEIQVRGWVFEANGPMIEGDNPLHFQFVRP